MCFILTDGYKSRWMESKHKSDYGQWKVSAGKFYGDAELDKGEVSFCTAVLRQCWYFSKQINCKYTMQTDWNTFST